jgi:beta-lactamase superfamily II metal-dependent hydrolase
MPPFRHLRMVLLVAALALVSAPPSHAVTATGRLQVIHLDVGQGDGAVIISPLGEVAMVDCGTANGTPAMGLSVVQQLQALGVTTIKHYFQSHYHEDHLARIDDIVNAGIVIQRAWDRGGSYTTGAYTTYANTIASVRHTLVKDQVIRLDSLSAHPVTIKCVNLAGAGLYSGAEENVLSVVLKLSYGEFDEVFGGDLPGSTTGSYKDIETTVGPQVGVVEAYKVHHHGSSTSTNIAWLNATQPKIAVISVGDGNSYGHPTSAALTRLHNANVKTYWTETGEGVAPNIAYDRVSSGQVIISATWQGAGVDTVRGTGIAPETFINSGTAPDATAPVVDLTSPDGGETWKAGSSHAITWTATDAVGVTGVTLAYSTDGGASFPDVIATGLANSGSYAWTVPAASTAAAKVRVIAQDAAGNAGRDSSSAVFSIDQWQIVATAGTGGNISPAGTTLLSQGASQTYTITPSTGYQVADVLVDDSSVGAVTGYTFTNVTADHTIAASFADVVAPLVTLTSPNGGESWEAASVHSVTWDASDNVAVDSVTVEYSVTSAHGPWLTVARGLANTGTADWSLPSTAADSAWVRVLAWDAAGNVGSDVSASALSIVSGATAVGDGGPATLALARPMPNPSRGATLLRFSLTRAGHARLEIVDVRGRTLLRDEGDLEAGAHSLRWDGRGPRGEAGGAGLYFVRLTTPWGTRTERLVRLQ